MTIHLYGIPNCDTVKKARKWLDANSIGYTFHDFKKEGGDPAKVESWIKSAQLTSVLNKRGTTYRKLTDDEKALAENSHAAVTLLVQHTSMIKRPVVEYEGGVIVGFKEDEWVDKLL